MRINARLDDEAARELDYLVNATDTTVSEVIRRALHVYWREIQGAQPRPFDILTECGLIGIADGPADLSETYKQVLKEGVAAKHDHR